MTGLRRVSQAAAALACAALGTLLVLESTEVIGGRWRRELAAALDDLAFPTWDLWISAVAGAGLAVLGVMIVAAQLAPAKKGLNTMHEVYDGSDGTTTIRGRAAISAVRHQLTSIEGVVDVDASIGRRRMKIELRVDDRASIEAIETETRSRLDHGFWIDLGLADFTLDLLITHDRNPPRVR